MVGLHPQGDIRQLAVHPGHPLQHQPVPQADLRAQAEGRPVAARQRDVVLGPAPQPLHVAGVAFELAAGLGQDDTGLAPAEQLPPQRLLQPAHPRAHRRLRDVQHVGGVMEVADLRHRQEGADLIQVHAHAEPRAYDRRWRSTKGTTAAPFAPEPPFT